MDGACLQDLDISIVPTPSLAAHPVLHNLIQLGGVPEPHNNFDPSPFVTKTSPRRDTKGTQSLFWDCKKNSTSLSSFGGFHGSCPIRLKLEVVFSCVWMAMHQKYVVQLSLKHKEIA